jgi:flagellar protein FliL
MKGKKKFIVPLVVLILLGGVYKTVLAKPPAKEKAKIDGTVYVFLNKSEVLPATEGASSDAQYGSLEQEPAVRDVITNVLTDANSNELVERVGREKLKEEVLKQIRATTDVKVDKVLFTDVAVQ